MYFKNFFHKFSKIRIFMKIIALGRATVFWKLFKTQNAHGGRNVLPKMFVGRWWYFLEKCWKTGWSEQDVRDRRTLPWMATGAVPVRIRTATHFSSENSHRETLHRGRMFRSPWAFVGVTAALRYEPCTQFINVSQRTLHIYFIDGCRVCPLDAQYKVKNKNSDLWASSQIAVFVLTLHGS